MSRYAALLLLLAAGCGETKPLGNSTNNNAAAVPAARPVPPAPSGPKAEKVRVRLETEAGPIVLLLDAKRAPITTANFLAYVDDGRFDGMSFYRAARTRGAAEGRGFIQGGIRRNYRLMLGPIEHEPTSQTGLRHEAGTISMARGEAAGAMGDFFITASAMPSMDARDDEPGYAAFGRVVEGMDTVRRILASPTVPDAGRGAMRGQMLTAPVRIIRAQRAEDGAQAVKLTPGE